MQKAQKGDTVLINYVVRKSDGQVVGKTEDNEPASVTIGSAQIFPEVEAALSELDVGGETSVTVSAENAFGPHREEMVVEIPRAQLPADNEPQPGMVLAAQQPDGTTVNLTIKAVDAETVTADGNHPLAGEDLTVGVTLVEIKSAA